jgi:hypothetical protein
MGIASAVSWIPLLVSEPPGLSIAEIGHGTGVERLDTITVIERLALDPVAASLEGVGDDSDPTSGTDSPDGPFQWLSGRGRGIDPDAEQMPIVGRHFDPRQR